MRCGKVKIYSGVAPFESPKIWGFIIARTAGAIVRSFHRKVLGMGFKMITGSRAPVGTECPPAMLREPLGRPHEKRENPEEFPRILKQVVKHLRCHPLTSGRAGNGRLSTSKSAKESRSITFKVIFESGRAWSWKWKERGGSGASTWTSRRSHELASARTGSGFISESSVKSSEYTNPATQSSRMSASRRFSAWLRTISDARSIALASMTEVAAI